MRHAVSRTKRETTMWPKLYHLRMSSNQLSVHHLHLYKSWEWVKRFNAEQSMSWRTFSSERSYNHNSQMRLSYFRASDSFRFHYSGFISFFFGAEWMVSIMNRSKDRHQRATVFLTWREQCRLRIWTPIGSQTPSGLGKLSESTMQPAL